MEIHYAVSLWNWTHYTGVPSLEHALRALRQLGYGAEFWDRWNDRENLYDEGELRQLKSVVQDMKISLHTAHKKFYSTTDKMSLHKKQIDAATELGAELIVLHPTDLGYIKDEHGKGDSHPDVSLTREIVTYASEKGVRLTLENGPLGFLAETMEQVEDLGFCLDTGHVYRTPHSLSDYLDTFKSRLMHIHLEDVLSPAETDLPGIKSDHYTPGSGGISMDDWQLLTEVLQEIDYRGVAVFEIRPRNPFQTALMATRFMQSLI